ncbi:class I SAM-dependent methyltransferase [Algibacter mikhailovii]|uniref:class I SAM-dependent methyltransferase n=1 Tax=Algibacter mikhailovii TaxID=425498 RepID=UPI002494AA0D|nr:class I SAM-dependent methyltransferase [Algibacter mikhailovii]
MSAAYYKTEASVNEYIELAKDVDGALLIDKLKHYLPSNSSVLEIGSGPGTDWNILNKFYQVVGSDNSEEFLKHLREQNSNGQFINLDAVTLKTDEIFDGIYSNKVMHHLTDVELNKSINRQFDVFNTNGIICHSFWRGEDSEIFKGLFVNYHEKINLEKFYQDKFDILYLDYYNEFDKDDSILIIAKKK